MAGAPSVPISGEWVSGGFDALPVQHVREEQPAPAARTEPPLAVVLGFIEKEIPRVSALLGWMATLSGRVDRTIYLVPFKGIDVTDLKKIAALAFANVQVIADSEGVSSDWQIDDKVRDAAGPNSLFRQTAWYFELRRGLGPWLWCEPDCVPLTRDWLEQLEAGYQASGKPFFGASMKWSQNGLAASEYINGAAIYPRDAVTTAPMLVTRTMWERFPEKEIAFDVAGGRQVFSKATTTDLIQLVYRSDKMVVPRPCTVLFHGDRAGKLLEKLLSGGVGAPSNETAETKQASDAVRSTGVARSPAVSHAKCKASSAQKLSKRKRGDAKCRQPASATCDKASSIQTAPSTVTVSTSSSNGAAKFEPDTARHAECGGRDTRACRRAGWPRDEYEPACADSEGTAQDDVAAADRAMINGHERATTRIVMPFTRLDDRIVATLEGYGLYVELVLMDDEEAYWRLLCDIWDERRDVLLIEHDILPWPGAVEELIACPANWCSFTYQINGGVGIHHAFGLTKLARGLMEAVPDVWRETQDRRWHTLDAQLCVAATRAGHTPHPHRPAVIHFK